MSTKKRILDSKANLGPKRKKAKVSNSGENPDDASQRQPAMIPSSADEEFDFPRGGGSSFTPLEYKLLRAEAMKEADEDILFKV